MARFHSIVGLISNSSTSIISFCTARSEGYLRDFIVRMMQALGVNGEPEDYFDFGVIPSDHFIDVYFESLVDQFHLRLSEAGIITDESNMTEAQQEQAVEWLKAHFEEWGVDEDGNYLEYETGTAELYLQPKTGISDVGDFSHLIYWMLDHEEVSS